jgi:hypothetical protein
MDSKIRAILISVICIISCNMASATDSTIMHIRKTNDFEVDGKGSSTAWNTTSWFILTKRKGNVSYQTKCKMLYSENGIYCLFENEDKKIPATMNHDFDDIYNEDVVEVFFWTDESSPIYFEYELSPNNVELPILVPNYDGKFFGWRPWHYEGDKKTRRGATIRKNGEQATGWTAEFFIPFKLLNPLQNVPAQTGTRWRVNFYRIDYDNGTTQWSWQPTRKNFHDYKSFGTVVFD